jgi:D-arginine dehydrogenase
MPSPDFDYLVIGAGIAGASAAASLSRRGRVALVEAEDHAGYHTTGRSAALYSAIYGNAAIRRLTRASASFLFDPPAGFAPHPLVRPRATLYFATEGQIPLLERFRADVDIASATDWIDGAQARELVPAFRPGYVAAAAVERSSADIDVDQLHQGFLRQVRGRGGQLRLKSPVRAIERRASLWSVAVGDARLTGRVLVNAAGAWGDAIAAMAGAAPIGLSPLRRTALLVDPPAGLRVDDWPAAIEIAEQFYFKPDAGCLLLSPADETPSAACDAQPEELDVAIAVDRFEQATGASIRRVNHKWAGLRVFTPDRTPAIGFDPGVEDFFWAVGQGGYGIQTAPALGELVGALAAREDVPHELAQWQISGADLTPARFRAARPNT